MGSKVYVLFLCRLPRQEKVFEMKKEIKQEKLLEYSRFHFSFSFLLPELQSA